MATPGHGGHIPPPDSGNGLSAERPWDGSTRPTSTPAAGREHTHRGRAAAQSLLDVHQQLREQLHQVRELVRQALDGEIHIATARASFHGMVIRQRDWTLGASCAAYCTLVAQHHFGEDVEVFPHLRRQDPGLSAVLDRLTDEHHVIHDLLDRVDAALVSLVRTHETADGVRRTVDLLADALLSHLAYEERELLEPMMLHYA